jgi:hypothetical protein
MHRHRSHCRLHSHHISNLTHPFKTVIPTEVGIQTFTRFKFQVPDMRKVWIPTSVGMTGVSALALP